MRTHEELQAIAYQLDPTEAAELRALMHSIELAAVGITIEGHDAGRLSELQTLMAFYDQRTAMEKSIADSLNQHGVRSVTIENYDGSMSSKIVWDEGGQLL